MLLFLRYNLSVIIDLVFIWSMINNHWSWNFRIVSAIKYGNRRLKNVAWDDKDQSISRIEPLLSNIFYFVSFSVSSGSVQSMDSNSLFLQIVPSEDSSCILAKDFICYVKSWKFIPFVAMNSKNLLWVFINKRNPT